MKKTTKRLRLRSEAIAEVTGYIFTLDDYPFMELFVHNTILKNGNLNKGEWHVSELRTGLKCGPVAKNRKEAMVVCEVLLNSKDKKLIQKQVEDMLRKFGGSLLDGENYA